LRVRESIPFGSQEHGWRGETITSGIYWSELVGEHKTKKLGHQGKEDGLEHTHRISTIIGSRSAVKRVGKHVNLAGERAKEMGGKVQNETKRRVGMGWS